MILLTDEQKDLYDKATSCDWRKKEFNNDYFCNKRYETLDIEIERCENPEIKCNENNYPTCIKIDEDKQNLYEDIIENTCKNCNRSKNDIKSCHNIKCIESD